MSSHASYNEIINLTRELVRIPSANPTGSEYEIGEYVFRWLSNQAVQVWKEPVEGQRFNVVARLTGQEQGTPPLIWMAHMDTVPAGEGWTTDPFGGHIIDGRLYGRGSADMKGGLAAAMIAFKNLASKKNRPKGDLILLATVDEEGPDMKGAMAVWRKGWVNQDSYLVAVEPSGLKVLPAHKGPLWYELTIQGKMAHAGKPDKGVDAIHAMSECLVRLKELVQQLPYDDELLGRATVNFGMINGGVKINMVPDVCRVQVDMRATIPMTVEEADSLIEQALREGTAQVPGAKATWQRLGLKRPPQKMPKDSPLLQAFLASVQAITGRADVAGFPAYTDAAILASLTGTPHCLTFGPGYLEQAHAIDEFIPIEQLELAVEVLKEAAIRLIW